MAKVTAQVFGGEPRVFDGQGTVADIKSQLGAAQHTATINGEPARDSDSLSDFDFVMLAPAIKGAVIVVGFFPAQSMMLRYPDDCGCGNCL